LSINQSVNQSIITESAYTETLPEKVPMPNKPPSDVLCDHMAKLT